MKDLITEIDILQESENCFLTYAEEVLCDRAIPAAEDGLLSVHRKLIWTMEEYLKMNSKSKTKKCNSIVGSTLATSYFHGDASCYGALCKLSQNYLMRYPLVVGQGSLGTQQENGMQASSRYTEAKPSIYADLMMNEFKKNVVPLVETYNNEYYEPVVLPSFFPNALVNGRESIGVSMSHNSLPNNLTEVCEGIIAFIKKHGNISTKELMKYIKGPDFPLGGTVINAKDIYSAFETGHSSVSLKVRGDYEIKDNKIIFTSIPYRTYRNKIKEQINANIDEFEKILDDFNDESSIGQNRLIFTLKKGIDPQRALNRIFALTSLQTTLSYNMNFIVNGTPILCSLKKLIDSYVVHQNNVMINAATFDKQKMEERLHIVEGLIIALSRIDEVIALIRQSENKADARVKLIDLLKIDDIQANAILDMKLSRLTKLDITELVNEKEDLVNKIKECELIITNQEHRNNILIQKIEELKKQYGDARRTVLLNIEETKEDTTSNITPEDVVVILSKTGEIKRVPKSSFKVQHRNGKGVKNIENSVFRTISTNTVDNLLVFTNHGKMYKILVDTIPVGTNSSKGVNINSLIKFDNNETVNAITSLNKDTNKKYVVFITKNGMVKKSLLSEYLEIKKSTGIAAIKLNDTDEVINVHFMDEENIVLLTKNGYGIRFETDMINPIGRVSLGVKGIKLVDDEVIASIPVKSSEDIIALFTTNGLGKKIKISEIPIQGRGGKGLIMYKNMKVAGGCLVSEQDNILLSGEKSICIPVTEIPLTSRISLGNIMIHDSNVSTITKL